MKLPSEKSIQRRFFFLCTSNSKRVSHLHITRDLYTQPFRIVFPIMQRCSNNNISPFQNQGGSNSRERNWVSLVEEGCGNFYLKHRSPLFYLQTALLLFSDACYLVCANELFLCRPGLKCHIGSRIFLPTASRLAECKQQGRMIGCASCGAAIVKWHMQWVHV